MNVTAKLLGFLVALLAVFGGAVGVGRVVGPVAPTTAASHGGMDMGKSEEGPSTTMPKGLLVSQDGYTFRLTQTQASPGTEVPVVFTIQGPDGRPVTHFDEEHEKRLHLIAIRRDFSGFQHVHPEMASNGTWSTTLDLTAGQWRLFADFKATGSDAVTLGTDLAVPGDYEPAAPSADSRTATVDGYTVTLDGNLAAGREAKLTLRVTRNGQPVTDLEPYLGAYGHLVALRAGDLAYLHVHPEGTPDDGSTKPGPGIVFYTEVPSSDRYQLYLNFKHEGLVRTAAFTLTASGGTSSGGSGPTGGGHSGDAH